jgi:gluconokinase
MKNKRFVIGLDVGTSSVKVAVFDEHANAVPGLIAHRSYSQQTTADGGATLEAELLYQRVLEVMGEIVQQIGTQSIPIAAVGFSCFWHSLVMLDSEGSPLTPVFLWGDTRPTSAAERLEAMVDPAQVRATTGAGLHASYWPAKIAWLEETHPDLFGQAKHIVSFGEYLYLCLFGRLAVSSSMASGTGLLDVHSCNWSSYILAPLSPRVPNMLPDLDDRPFQGLRPEYANRWPDLKAALWFPASGDGACSNIGAGGMSSDRFVVTIGTSSALRVILPGTCRDAGVQDLTSRLSEALWCYRVDRSRLIVGGALSEGGNVVDWLERSFRLPALETVEAEIGKRAPDAGGLTILPYISGERSPHWNGNATLTISGLYLRSTPADVYQAALESIAYQLRDVYDALVAVAGEPHLIIGTGGALLRSPVWTQINANVLEHEVVASAVTESSSRGAAALALEKMGLLNLQNLDLNLGTSYVLTETSDEYRIARLRQSKLYDAVARVRPK